MSAHVVPKAKPFPDEDDPEEKTTIESGWEDEASTTVEQGEVAEKIREVADNAMRPLRTGVTGTGANQLDEPTVDDQHANSQIAALVPGIVGHLIITQGNDVGQEFDIRPGKAYTIGRAIDNDVVLTDIAVSRKHFDLRFEDGAWVIVDRGSGNGTVVNGNLEDNPFMLAHGDTIEIGNTVFRFDQPEGTPRRKPSFSEEDEEMSTVAGKPMRSDLPDPEPPPPMRERPKTLPPPTPIRPRSPSSFPPLGPPPQMQPQPASTMPLPQMANRAPMVAPAQAPTMLAAEPVSAPMPSMMPPQYQHGVPPRPLMAGYPQYNDLPQQNVYGNGLLVAPNGQRGDASTAHVAPTPYGAAVAQPTRIGGQLSRRAKLILGAGGLALLAGITTVAIVKSSAPAKKAAAFDPGPGSAAVTPDPPKQVVVMPSDPPKQDPPKEDPPKVSVVTPPVKQDPPKQDPPKKDPPKVTVVTPPPPHKDPPRIAKKDPPPHKDPPPRQDPPLRQDPPPHKDPPKRVAVAVADTGAARSKADDLYHAKRFTEASNVLASAAKSADESDAKELRHLADLYVRVGRGLSAGTAPAAKPEDAFTTLRSAENFDRAAGGAFQSEFESALAKVAPKAATAYMADKNYEQARTAVLEAEKLGAGTTGTNMVKQALERAAQDLYNQASKDASSDPASAKEKCQRIINFADSKGQWYQKAARLKATL